MPCRVSFLPNRFGKVPYSHKNVIFMEYDGYLRMLADYLPDAIADNEDFANWLR